MGRNRDRRRAKARERALSKGGTTLTVHVECSHGEHNRHDLTIHVDKYGVLKHVSSRCERHPPSSEEATVMRGLMGQHYASCTDVVHAIKNLVNTVKNNDADTRRRARYALPASATDNLALMPLLNHVQDTAYARKAGKHNGSFAAPTWEAQRAALRLATLQRLTSGVVLPAGWGMWLEETNDKIKFLRVRMSTEERQWGYSETVADYIGGGRFTLRSDGIRHLAANVSRTATRDRHGYYACTVCGTRATNIKSHAKTKKHLANVEAAVLSALEEVGRRLAQNGKHK